MFLCLPQIVLWFELLFIIHQVFLFGGPILFGQDLLNLNREHLGIQILARSSTVLVIVVGAATLGSTVTVHLNGGVELIPTSEDSQSPSSEAQTNPVPAQTRRAVLWMNSFYVLFALLICAATAISPQYNIRDRYTGVSGVVDAMVGGLDEAADSALPGP